MFKPKPEDVIGGTERFVNSIFGFLEHVNKFKSKRIVETVSNAGPEPEPVGKSLLYIGVGIGKEKLCVYQGIIEGPWIPPVP